MCSCLPQLFSAVAGQGPPASAVVGAALAAGVAEGFAVVGREEPAAVSVVAEASAVAGAAALAAGVAETVLGVVVAAVSSADLVAVDAAVVRLAAVAVCATVRSAVAGGEFAQLVPFDAAVAPVVLIVSVQVASVALVAANVSVQSAVAGGEFAQLVLFDAAVAPVVLIVSVQVASVALVAANVSARSAVAVCATARSAFDGLAQDVGVQSLFGGLPCARLTFQVAFLFPVAAGEVRCVFCAGLARLFPAPPFFVCLVRWTAGSQGSAVALVSPAFRQGLPSGFSPAP